MCENQLEFPIPRFRILELNTKKSISAVDQLKARGRLLRTTRLSTCASWISSEDS